MLLAVCLIAMLPMPARAQGRLGGGQFGRWAPTGWSFLDSRVKCDGAMPFTGGMPTSWRVQFRNQAKEPVSLDLTSTVAGSNHKPSVRRITVKPGAMREVQVELPTDCAGGVQTAVDKVRLGVDHDSTAYVKPDRREE